MPLMVSRAWDHPRMCGEHVMMVGSFRLSKGSSPHVRGALLADRAIICAFGIIPACAGSTSTQSDQPTEYGDHPRMCGEHMPIIGNNNLDSGSSPHVRGARVLHAHGQRSPGIIPACAGSTCCRPGW